MPKANVETIIVIMMEILSTEPKFDVFSLSSDGEFDKLFKLLLLPVELMLLFELAIVFILPKA